LKLFLLVFCAALTASAQATGDSTSGDGKKDPAAGPVSSGDNPAQQVRDARSWEMGPFVNWGTGLSERSDFKFFSLGFQLGKPISRVLHAGILSGQFELAGNIMPLWQAYTPAPHEQTFVYQRRHLHRSQHHPGHLSLEFPHPVETYSAVVPGRRRARLYDPQVPA
jgi:hypothetical protein